MIRFKKFPNIDTIIDKMIIISSNLYTYISDVGYLARVVVQYIAMKILNKLLACSYSKKK